MDANTTESTNRSTNPRDKDERAGDGHDVEDGRWQGGEVALGCQADLGFFALSVDVERIDAGVARAVAVVLLFLLVVILLQVAAVDRVLVFTPEERLSRAAFEEGLGVLALEGPEPEAERGGVERPADDGGDGEVGEEGAKGHARDGRDQDVLRVADGGHGRGDVGVGGDEHEEDERGPLELLGVLGRVGEAHDHGREQEHGHVVGEEHGDEAREERERPDEAVGAVVLERPLEDAVGHARDPRHVHVVRDDHEAKQVHEDVVVHVLGQVLARAGREVLHKYDHGRRQERHERTTQAQHGGLEREKKEHDRIYDPNDDLLRQRHWPTSPPMCHTAGWPLAFVGERDVTV